MNQALNWTRERCAALDADDPLAHARDRFTLPEGVIYLDGNSLGALPRTTADVLANTVREEWGQGLIRSWNQAGWIDLARLTGADIARLIGVQPNEVVACDSTSINLYKLVAGAFAQARTRDAKRCVILSEKGNFPTDLYMAEGLAQLAGSGAHLRWVEGENLADHFGPDVAVAMFTQVDYRSGRVLDMAALNRAACEAGHDIVWDLSHSAGALDLDLARDGAQLAVGCGYKYLNGGPGAPAFVYVKHERQVEFPMVLSGWLGHANPFAFDSAYQPAPDISRFQCGTPSILALRALREGVAAFADLEMVNVRAKSLALSDLFWALMDAQCAEFGFECISPREHARRGSQLSFAHAHAWPIMQAIIDRGVIGDFRAPNLLRFGFAPLYLRHTDIWDAVMIVREVMQTGAWKAEQYQARNAVT
jgi:kynureninase